MNDSHQAPLCVPRSHPSLEGHFPGNPVVPGVVVLDHVLEAVERWLGELPDALRLPQVKFMQPLLPDQPAEIQLQRTGDRIRLRVTRGQQLLVTGELDTAR